MAVGALPGFRDFYPHEFAQRAHIFRAWREVARRYAFSEYDGPLLEPLDLYTKKSGEEIVGQLYNFKDKGDRDVALRPEMTPTFARMVGARANALRKPVRWFSIPQLFRYERPQRGRLREHFQLNVDIVGEASELADAELLCVAIDIMKELGLGPTDVRARVSDRLLLNALLTKIGVGSEQVAAVFSVIDKVDRVSAAATEEKLAETGLNPSQIARIVGLTARQTVETLKRDFGTDGELGVRFAAMDSYVAHLTALGVGDWIDLDLRIVRGLAYYTGIVFELFDAKGELRAICGGGRYDTLLESLGGANLPALGFGMGDVVLGELLKERGLLAIPEGSGADLFIVGGNGVLQHGIADALRLASTLRAAGLSVDYSLNAEVYQTRASRNQVDGAKKSGARAAIYFDSESEVVVQGLIGKLNDAPKAIFPASPLLANDSAAVAALMQWYKTNLTGSATGVPSLTPDA